MIMHFCGLLVSGCFPGFEHGPLVPIEGTTFTCILDNSFQLWSSSLGRALSLFQYKRASVKKQGPKRNNLNWLNWLIFKYCEPVQYMLFFQQYAWCASILHESTKYSLHLSLILSDSIRL